MPVVLSEGDITIYQDWHSTLQFTDLQQMENTFPVSYYPICYITALCMFDALLKIDRYMKLMLNVFNIKRIQWG